MDDKNKNFPSFLYRNIYIKEFATIDPLYFMNVYFSMMHLFF